MVDGLQLMNSDVRYHFHHYGYKDVVSSLLISMDGGGKECPWSHLCPKPPTTDLPHMDCCFVLNNGKCKKQHTFPD